MKRKVLTADLGGTNLRIAVIDESGKVLARKKTPTPAGPGTDDFINSIVKISNESLVSISEGPGPEALVLAVPAVLDIEKGIIVESPNLPYLNGLNASERLSEQLGLPVLLENDANAATLGESWAGASKGTLNSVCLTLGTGVGGGLIIDGSLVRGVDGTAGELGHVCVEPEGFLCGCGSYGCLEQYASATGIRKMIDQMAADFADSDRISTDTSPKELFDLANHGNEFAIAIFRRVGFSLGLAIAGFVNMLNPEVVVVGGGLSASWDLFAPTMTETVRKRAFKRPAERVKLLRAELGDDSGILGAAALIFQGKGLKYSAAE